MSSDGRLGQSWLDTDLMDERGADPANRLPYFA